MASVMELYKENQLNSEVLCQNFAMRPSTGVYREYDTLFSVFEMNSCYHELTF